MYRFDEPIHVVRGVGPALAEQLHERGIHTVLDLLLHLPFRYEDRSHFVSINELAVNELATFKAQVIQSSTSYRGRRVMTKAVLQDESGKVNAFWFNNRYIGAQLKKGSEWFFSGKLSDKKALVQPTVERIQAETIHTGRLVPLYSDLGGDIKIGIFRRLLKEITDRIDTEKHDFLETLSIDQSTEITTAAQLPALRTALRSLHFPDDEAIIASARERLALEELLGLIYHSNKIKDVWKNHHSAFPLQLPDTDPAVFEQWLSTPLPFSLTSAQRRSIEELLTDLQNDTPMNRLLIGDVGSGKTVVVGIGCFATVQLNHHNAVIVAPTQILAQQHEKSLRKMFPTLNIVLVTTKESKKFEVSKTPTLYIGTHAVLNHLEKIQPLFIAYDEQHRFGVKQRSFPTFPTGTPHVLTLSATPIPRSLMLTLFSHLKLSVIDEMPPGRIPTTSWLVDQKKKQNSLSWIAQKIQETNGQALIVCPFIEPSVQETLSAVAAATDLFATLKKFYAKEAPKLTVGLLHGKLNLKEKQKVIDAVFAREIDILITTPVVEVGVDLPQANIIVIEAAERFGLASLHQLRGRVGRAGQESFCLLFSNSKTETTLDRLKIFTQENNGLKLAEKDLQNRGAGDLFGFQQHGFDTLRFASWTNLELIQSAHLFFQKLKETSWQPCVQFKTPEENAPVAN